MAPIVATVEISRPPDDVFAYATDASRFAEWQAGVVRSQAVGSGPLAVGSRCTMTRVMGSEITSTMEVTEYAPPRIWAARGIDGPVRTMVRVVIDPLDDGARSRVTTELEFEARGLGKVLMPLVLMQARDEAPKSSRNLKARMENGG
jgi:uncharacterized protein YndB with AHSA1/START domain